MRSEDPLLIAGAYKISPSTRAYASYAVRDLLDDGVSYRMVTCHEHLSTKSKTLGVDFLASTVLPYQLQHSSSVLGRSDLTHESSKVSEHFATLLIRSDPE